MDTEKQKSSPGGTVPGEKVPPVLMAEDVAALEELCGDVSGYFYKNPLIHIRCHCKTIVICSARIVM